MNSVVIGAGFGGIAAALRLKAKGHDVTLIEKHTEDELVAVLAHEDGHFKKKHIFSGLIMSIIQIGVMTFFFEL